MLAVKSLIFTVLCLIFVNLFAPAQSARHKGPQAQTPKEPPGQEQQPGIVSLEATEVIVPVTVRNRYGRPIAGLTKSDFNLFEDGRRQQITGFETESVPAHIVMLIDVSGSVRTEINDIRLSALALINELGEKDRVCIYQFNDRVRLVTDWTSDKLKLQRALLQLPAVGETAFYNALHEAATQKLSQVEGRRTIIVFTDGVNTYEGKPSDRTGNRYPPPISAGESFEALQRAEAMVYVISKTRAIREYLNGLRAGSIFRVIDPRDPYIQQFLHALNQAEEWLIMLAERTGGRIYFPNDQTDLAGAYKDIAVELNNQYVLRYTPDNSDFDGRFRRIRVTTGNPSYQANSREGYYAAKR